jgi:hypothetical protein
MFAKRAKMTKKIYSTGGTVFNMQKNAEFNADFKFVEWFKNALKKLLANLYIKLY